MDVLLPVLGVVGVLFVGVVSPGPSFIFIAQRSIAQSRLDGVWASIGMGVGGVFFAVLALAGIHLLLTTFPIVYNVLKILGGLYLLFLAYKIWRSAASPLVMNAPEETSPSSGSRSFLLGLVTQVSNPKTAVVYSTVFATFLPNQYDWRFVVSLVIAVFLVETLWYAFVAIILSTRKPREVYRRFKKHIDRGAATLLGAIGGKLVVDGLVHPESE